MSVDMPVALSTASAWQRFHGCDPDYIRDVCHGRCCDAPGRAGGTMITIHRSEQAAIEARGGTVRDGLLVTDGQCTFKEPTGLCGLHFTADKPFGCIASPWTLTPNGRSLIIRNRYRLLVCYAASARRRGERTDTYPPAYVAFRASLDLIIGSDRAADLITVLDRYGDPAAPGYRGPQRHRVLVPIVQWRRLRDNDATKRARHGD